MLSENFVGISSEFVMSFQPMMIRNVSSVTFQSDKDISVALSRLQGFGRTCEYNSIDVRFVFGFEVRKICIKQRESCVDIYIYIYDCSIWDFDIHVYWCRWDIRFIIYPIIHRLFCNDFLVAVGVMDVMPAHELFENNTSYFTVLPYFFNTQSVINNQIGLSGIWYCPFFFVLQCDIHSSNLAIFKFKDAVLHRGWGVGVALNWGLF